MLPKLDTFSLLINGRPIMDKNAEHWSMIKHGKNGVHRGSKNRVSSSVFSTLEPPNFLATFGDVYRLSWGLNYFLLYMSAPN